MEGTVVLTPISEYLYRVNGTRNYYSHIGDFKSSVDIRLAVDTVKRLIKQGVLREVRI